ncbi:hypothetical protein BDW42DRAFT_175030 [Aspergillus taichungensis]|uniref:Uncharacterized protein n=1 Tax=Aspergillus taichungensis TaxID=482145 RepID=A0A2J5HM98_9EURO|nr:hypothetical protein BDW42DRAFT_175030 [Aspergillus taichungensis]
MRFSNVLTFIVLPASMVLAVPVEPESAGLDARGCKWKNYDDCYENDKYFFFSATTAVALVSLALFGLSYP